MRNMSGGRALLLLAAVSDICSRLTRLGFQGAAPQALDTCASVGDGALLHQLATTDVACLLSTPRRSHHEV